MVDGVNGPNTGFQPFMTGEYRDSLKKSPAFSIDSILSEPVSSTPNKAPAAAATTTPAGSIPASQSQNLAVSTDFRQLFAGPSAVTPQTVTPPPAAAPAPETAQPDPPFVPAFREASGSGPGLPSWGLNRTYFASTETAKWIASKYGTGEVLELPFSGAGGIFTASANEYHIKLKDGRLVNAGLLAGYYERNPPDKFPGLADKLIKSTLGLA